VKHFTIYSPLESNPDEFIDSILSGVPTKPFEFLADKNGAVFSQSALRKYIQKEARHGIKVLTEENDQSLRSMSSGEQKKLFLAYLFNQRPDFLILVDPFNNLDKTHQKVLKKQLVEMATTVVLILFVCRLRDTLEFDSTYYAFQDNKMVYYNNLNELNTKFDTTTIEGVDFKIPEPLTTSYATAQTLVEFNKVSVSFDGKPILKDISWIIEKGEFWQLIGANGSGKSTLIQMITGDSHKACGQEVLLFGKRKGSGESVWDIKKRIGYFTPSMILTFKGYDSVLNMLISGIHDSIGLYTEPSETERQLALTWLKILKMAHKKAVQFRQLSEGEKRLVMTARAMIKHPPLLLLDEPTIGLDEKATARFIGLINQLAAKTETTIVYVSHQDEARLRPRKKFILTMGANGSTGSECQA